MLAALVSAAALLGPAAVQAGAQASSGGSCNEVRIAPYSACVSSYWASPGEDWLLAGEDETGQGTLCVYLSRWVRRSWAWTGSTASCEFQPDIATEGASGHPTIYNGTGHWITAFLVIFN
jgi:hypothetical protein